MLIDFNAPVVMRDGTRLSAAVCRPDGDGRHPAVLTRTCYTKWIAPLAERAARWTANGYVYVVQDVRGRGDSAGVFYPLINEREDGVDTIAWIARQSWCDGRVVMIGGSYAGWTQLYPASENPPALVAAAPTATPPDPDLSFPKDHGMVSPAAAAWLASLDGHTNQDLSGCDVAGAYAMLPIIDFDRHIGRHLQAWRDWVTQPPGSDYWRELGYQTDLLGSRIPLLHVSGWYDDCLIGALQNFAALSTRAVDPAARGRQRLMIGPWAHGAMGQRSLGAIDHGADAEIDMTEFTHGWFDAHLKDEPDPLPPVRLFVMGRNAWIDEDAWPIARTSYVPLYFRGAGAANSRLGDGELSLKPPGDEPADAFDYDPADPVPYGSDFDWRQVGGPDDFAQVELRDDILVYTGPTLTEPLLVCGPLQVRLFAASSAVDTDWTAKILDVHPDGKAIRLNDGAVRARFRKDDGKENFLTPGAVEEYVIDCWATCIELAPGHRLRVEIASSAFGKIDVNLNGGGPVGEETEPVIARQTVYHDRQRPSCLLLPVIKDQS